MNEIVKYLPEGESNWKLFKVIFKSFLATKNVLKKYRMNKAVFDSIIMIIKEKMLNALVNAGEMVGIISAQTLGEISTQLTLNSVTYETEVLIRDINKKIKKYQIGEFIEREIRRSGVVDYDESKNTTYATCADYFEIQACDEDGNVFWDVIEAVTKHPVINRDGSNTMLKVTTEDEREVIATKAKSFLKLIDGKIVPIEGENLKVGDYLPISTKEVDYEENFTLDLKELLSPNEYVYGSELEKAKAVMKEHHWWLNHANKTFILPHKRSDTVVQLASERVRSGRKTKCTILDGFVYMLNSCTNVYTIPEVIDLDYNFGYLVGAYAAEGAMTRHQISIANNVTSYFDPIIELCESWNITTKIYKQENKNKEGWNSQDLRIYNTLLCKILEKLVGKLSHNKFISDIITFSNKECLRGFLDAYIGGDGSVNKTSIFMHSTSKVMLKSVQIILRAFGVFSYIHKPTKQETNNRGSLDIKQMYKLCIYGEQSKKLANILNIKIDYKQDNLALIKIHDHKTKYGKRFDKIPNEIDGELFIEERYDTFPDIIFSKIKSIEEVPNTTDYAYDLTVKNTKNFLNGEFIAIRDTFHSAGVGAGSLVITEGIPRLREIIGISKNLKSKNMLIYLNKEYSSNKDNARKVQSRFAYTQLKHILSKTEILFDNKEGMTDNNEDIEFIKSYKEFSELFDNDNIDESCLSPWILRLIFDKESLMNRKITVQEIQETIKENFHNDQEIDCIYSDDSVNDVVMRIIIKQDSKGSFLEFMKDFEKQLIELPLRGISDINQVEIAESNIIKYNDDGSFTAGKEWVLKTSGSNLLDILGDNAVDISRTITNDILEFHEIFGIEATRELIYRELSKVYAEKHPNQRHIQLMADIMTYRGKLMQIDRHGINKNPEIGPIGKASFEEVMNNFTKAALFAEKDNMKGVSANILAGQFCKSGTNSFEILIDEDKMLEKVEISNYLDSDYIDINENSINDVFSKTYNDYEPTDNVDDSDFNFGFGIEDSKQFLLNSVDTSNVIILNKENINNNESKNIDFEKISIDVPSYENVDNNGNNMNIDFEQIDINEPIYEEEKEVEQPEKTKKTIKVKKVKSEEKPKKVKITKKKKSDENEK
jgi:DNA-directed RNA polymerase beta' subunit